MSETVSSNKLLVAHQALNLLRLALPKLGIGWMFALLTANFNRVSIHELAIPAVIITSMIGCYHFLSPFQIYFGSLADRFPIFRMKRTPYLFLGSMIASIIFLFLPAMMLAMSQSHWWGFLGGFFLLIVFGVGLAMSGNAHLALISDITTDKTRGVAVALVWTTMILGLVLSGVVMKYQMPVYHHETLVKLYSITPVIVFFTCGVGLLGLEPRVKYDLRNPKVQPINEPSIKRENMIRLVQRLFSTGNATRLFFLFIVGSTIGIFLQDTILEVFGAAVLGLSLKETSSFQPIWGIGVLGSMLLVGLLSLWFRFDKQSVARIGSGGTAIGLLLLAIISLSESSRFMFHALFFLGLFTGFHTIGTLTTMMEMTSQKERATYMGLWGFATSLGSGLSGVLAGALVSLLIETSFFSASIGYAIIFFIESCLMILSVYLLGRVSISDFKLQTGQTDANRSMPENLTPLKPADLTIVMEAETGD
ncbi:MAG: BCD family MFS transporter [Chloroherpetonaceae bacterium]|nr:BCD family MFS transporter [Chloroherpetonaceae bacterium]